jgi:hypothetical protein
MSSRQSKMKRALKRAVADADFGALSATSYTAAARTTSPVIITAALPPPSAAEINAFKASLGSDLNKLVEAGKALTAINPAIKWRAVNAAYDRGFFIGIPVALGNSMAGPGQDAVARSATAGMTDTTAIQQTLNGFHEARRQMYALTLSKAPLSLKVGTLKTVTAAPQPMPTVQPTPEKVVDRGVYQPVPYEVPTASYTPPNPGITPTTYPGAHDQGVTWAPPSKEPLVKQAASTSTALALPVATPQKLGIFQRLMAWLGFVKKSNAQIAGDAPMSRLEAAGSLVRRARQGDQNAMAVIVMARENAQRGNVQAKLAVACIKKYIEANPAGPSSFAGETVVHTGPAYRKRLQLLARRDIPISRIDQMLGWELGE